MIGYHEPLSTAGGGVTELNKGYKREGNDGQINTSRVRGLKHTHTHKQRATHTCKQ